MVRRRKNKPNVAVHPRAAAARWPAFLFGFAAGAVAMLVVGALDPGPDREGGAEGGPGSEEGAGEASASQMPRFEFYHILPEMEVALPHLETGEAAEPPEKPAEAPAGATETVARPADAPAGESEGASPPVETAAEATQVAAKPAEVVARTAEDPEEPAEAPAGATETVARPADAPAGEPEGASPPVETVAEAVAEAAKPPEKPAAPPVEQAAARPSETIAEAGSVYVLQVGSFRSSGDAESMRARLALIGLEAVVQTVAIDGEAAWHRVRAGPYTELRALNRARIRLRENQIEALALRVRSP